MIVRRYRCFNNKQGASSVLIILMMVVLVVFGLAALTTSMAAMRLAEKSNEWTKEYYLLEEKAENSLFHLDSILYDAEIESINYIEKKLYLKTGQTLFPDNIQEMIYKSFNFHIPAAAGGEYLSRVMKAAFYKSAIDSLLDEYPMAEFNYSGGYLRQILEDEGFGDVTLGFVFSENEGEFSKNVDVVVKLQAPWYNITIENGSVSGNRAKSQLKRYEIITWREWQSNFDYSDQIEFEDIFDDVPSKP